MKSSETQNELAGAVGNNIASPRVIAFGWGLAAGIGAVALWVFTSPWVVERGAIPAALAWSNWITAAIIVCAARRRCQVSDATRGPSKRRAAGRARLKDEIDAGRARDKVPGFDPGAAPLGTDEESAGTPPAPDGDQAVGSSMGRIEQAADPKGNDRSVYECRTG